MLSQQENSINNMSGMPKESNIALRNTAKSARKRLATRELAELAVMCALMFIGKEVMRMIPNVHPVALIILLCVNWYGWKALYPVVGFVGLEIMLNGIGLWNVMYIYVWPILVLIAMPLRGSTKWWAWALVAALHGFIFGAMCAVPYIFTSGWAGAVAYWMAGLSFDLIHGVSNFLIVLLLMPLLTKRLGKYVTRA